MTQTLVLKVSAVSGFVFVPESINKWNTPGNKLVRIRGVILVFLLCFFLLGVLKIYKVESIFCIERELLPFLKPLGQSILYF